MSLGLFSGHYGRIAITDTLAYYHERGRRPGSLEALQRTAENMFGMSTAEPEEFRHLLGEVLEMRPEYTSIVSKL
jgi:hypothetical protein